MADPRDDDKPEYTLYRAKPKFLRRGGDDGGLRDMQQDAPPEDFQDAPPRRRRRWFPGRRRGRRIGVWRVVRWLLTALVAWLAISLVLFLISAQIQSSKVASDADAELGGAGYTLTSPNTVLVLGSDARAKGSKEAGANKIGQPSRSDSILLMRIGGGHNATLSIPRDTIVPIPGHGEDKINAAYAYGGPALAIRTIEQYLGIPINHLVEVNFENFPQLIDSLGGVTYRGGCVVSKINGGFKNGGYTLRLKGGEQEINGKQALALARTRKNECNAKESDLTRARRQQKILGSIKDKVTSFETFIRLPWVAWAAPKAIRSDMSGPSLLGLVGAELSAGTAKPTVLKPTGVVTQGNGGQGLTVDVASKRAAVERFLR
jgi:LCP family protein required for cell wall assembly